MNEYGLGPVQLHALHHTSCMLCHHSLVDHHETTLHCQHRTKRYWWSRSVQCACDMAPPKPRRTAVQA